VTRVDRSGHFFAEIRLDVFRILTGCLGVCESKIFVDRERCEDDPFKAPPSCNRCCNTKQDCGFPWPGIRPRVKACEELGSQSVLAWFDQAEWFLPAPVIAEIYKSTPKGSELA